MRSVFFAIVLHQYAGMMWYCRILILFVAAAPLFYLIFRTPVLSEIVLLGTFCLMATATPLPIAIEYLNFQ